MNLVVGLGNPGARYQTTRHNLGFRVLDQLERTEGGAGWKSQFDGLASEIWLAGGKVLLLKPMTYMNRSGRSVRAAVDFFKLELSSLLVVCDDFNVKLGKFRFRSEGSSGGQNGLKDVIAHLGTEVFDRLRVGVGPVTALDPADFVLQPFAADESALVGDVVIESARAVEWWCRSGIASAMNEFNGKDLTKE